MQLVLDGTDTPRKQGFTFSDMVELLLQVPNLSSVMYIRRPRNKTEITWRVVPVTVNPIQLQRRVIISRQRDKIFEKGSTVWEFDSDTPSSIMFPGFTLILCRTASCDTCGNTRK